MNSHKNSIKFLFALLILASVTISCDKMKSMMNTENKLYFVESYDKVKGEIGKSDKFTTGSLTVMVDLTPKKEKIGVSSVDINITDLGKNEVVSTKPYEVTPDMDYIFFDGVEFETPGKYKVSLLKKDGTVVVSGQVEIVKK